MIDPTLDPTDKRYWKRIATQIPGKTPEECFQQYHRQVSTKQRERIEEWRVFFFFLLQSLCFPSSKVDVKKVSDGKKKKKKEKKKTASPITLDHRAGSLIQRHNVRKVVQKVMT